jgi:hypothetical protein
MDTIKKVILPVFSVFLRSDMPQNVVDVVNAVSTTILHFVVVHLFTEFLLNTQLVSL